MYQNETNNSDAGSICLELDINNNRRTSTQLGHRVEGSDEYGDTVVESPSQQKRKRSPRETVKTRKPKCRSSWIWNFLTIVPETAGAPRQAKCDLW